MRNFKTFIFTTAILLFLAIPLYAQETQNMKDGLRLYYSRDFSAAKEQFQDVLDKEPSNSMAIMYLADCYRQDKTISKFLEILEEKALANPKDPYVKCHLGFAYFCQSMMTKDDIFEEATNQFQEALKIDTNNSLGYTGMGTIYYQKRLIPRAKSYFTKAIKLNTKDTMALERLGDIYLNDDKSYMPARNAFEEIISLYPSYPDAYFYYASASQAIKEFDTAIEYFNKASAMDPLGITLGYYAPVRIGDIYYKELKDYAKALEFYNNALKINPENSYAKNMAEKSKNPPKENKEESK